LKDNVLNRFRSLKAPVFLSFCRLLIYGKFPIKQTLTPKNLSHNGGYCRKFNPDLACEIIHILYSQAVHIYGLGLSDWKDIFVNRLTFR
jgi:hypothetical protein